MFKNLPITFLLFLFAVSFSFSQVEYKGTPISFTKSELFADEAPMQIMPAEMINIPRMLEEDDMDLEDGLPLRFAHVFEVNYNLDNSGQWKTLPNGDRVWRLTVWSPGAMNLNFGYNRFYMPSGAKFFIYNQDKTEVQGAFTSKNNRSYRQFATRIIEDNKVTFEYYEPAEVIGEGELSIFRIGHGYRDLDGNTADQRSGSCQVNINCPEGNDWQIEKKGIARILMDQAFLCSGTLINNARQDFTPYFSIANHCIVGTGHDALTNSGVPLYIFYWNFECPTPLCVPNVAEDDCGSLDQSTQGGNLVASSGGTPRSPYSTLNADFALILLDDNPMETYDVYFNGFDRRGPNEGYAPAECIGIHHPAGDEKKISTDTDGAYQDETDDNYWKLFWESTDSGHSVTEGGSSGSPLFDKDTKRVIGQLFGGSSNNCDLPAEDTGLYGGFYYSWENAEAPVTGIPQRRLKDWLDPDGTDLFFIDGLAPDDLDMSPPTVSFGSGNSTFDETPETGDPCYPYKDHTINFKISKTPSMDATASIFVAEGATATNGSSADYEVLTSTIVFPADGSNNEQQVTVRVYDDPLAEEEQEIFTLDYTLDNGGGDAVETPANHQHAVTINDNDKVPETGGTPIPTTLLTEDFSGTDFSMWQILTLEGDNTNQWILGETDTGVGGSGVGTTTNAGMDGDCAFITDDFANARYDYSDAATNTILFAPVNGVGAINMQLSFIWACVGQDEGNPVDYGLLVYSLNGTDFVEISGVGHFSNRVTATGMGTTTVSLPAEVEGQAFFIGFQWINDGSITSQLPLAIDDIQITADVTQITNITTAINEMTPAQAHLDAMTTVHFYDPTDNSIMMTIENMSDHDFNCTDVFVDRSGTMANASWQTGKETTQKSFRIIPTDNAMDKPYKVTLYYTKDEIENWEMNNTDGADRTALKMVKTSGSVDDQDGNSFEVADVTEAAFGDHFTYTATFSSGFSGFALGNLDPPETSLAVSINAFTAKPLNSSILLSWKTLAEVENRGFHIQRTTALDTGFKTIAWVDGNSKASSYQFEDKDVVEGQLYYYRLQQEDFSAKRTTSSIVTAILESNMNVDIAPNPTSNVLWVNINSKQVFNGKIRVLDMLGRIVEERQLTMDRDNLLSFDVKNYTEGVYLLQVLNENMLMYSEKFVKE